MNPDRDFYLAVLSTTNRSQDAKAMFWHKLKLALAQLLRLDLRHSQRHYAEILEHQISNSTSWLEVGCGRQILPFWTVPEDAQLRMISHLKICVGVDVDEAIRDHSVVKTRVYALAGELPFAGETFDLVTANMVVEHFDQVTSILADIHRVMKPGGRFVFHTPNYWNYFVFLSRVTPEWLKRRVVWVLERRCEEDRFVTYYRMNTEPAIYRAAELVGFRVEELRFVDGNGLLGRLGLIGVLECFPLKLCSVLLNGRLRSNLICCMQKQRNAVPEVQSEHESESSAVALALVGDC